MSEGDRGRQGAGAGLGRQNAVRRSHSKRLNSAARHTPVPAGVDLSQMSPGGVSPGLIWVLRRYSAHTFRYTASAVVAPRITRSMSLSG